MCDIFKSVSNIYQFSVLMILISFVVNWLYDTHFYTCNLGCMRISCSVSFVVSLVFHEKKTKQTRTKRNFRILLLVIIEETRFHHFYTPKEVQSVISES